MCNSKAKDALLSLQGWRQLTSSPLQLFAACNLPWLDTNFNVAPRATLNSGMHPGTTCMPPTRCRKHAWRTCWCYSRVAQTCCALHDNFDAIPDACCSIVYLCQQHPRQCIAVGWLAEPQVKGMHVWPVLRCTMFTADATNLLGLLLLTLQNSIHLNLAPGHLL